MIELDSSVAIQKVGGDYVRLCRVQKKREMVVQKLRFFLDDAIGKPYGLYEVSSKQLKRICPSKLKDSLIQGDVGDLAGVLKTVPPLSIKEITSDGDQQFTGTNNHPMNDNELPSVQMIAKLIESNSKFAERTELSRKKYIRRKASRYSERLFIQKPNLRLIAQSFYSKDPERIGNLRFDLLSQMLTLSTVHYGSHCLVFEQCAGLVTAAAIDRIGGCGACIHLHRGKIAQSIPCIEHMNFTKECFSTFLPLRISTLVNGAIEEPLDTERDDNQVQCVPDSTVGRRMERLALEKKAWELLCNSKIDSLIIASRDVIPKDVLQYLWPSIALAARIVVYSPIAEVIAETYHWLKRKDAVEIHIHDAFLRNYVVLSDVTRPVMQQSFAGGIVLSAVKVHP